MPTASYDPETGQLLGNKRLLCDVFSSIQALTAQQRTNLWNDLKAPAPGAPRKYLTDEFVNAAAIFALDYSANQTSGGQLVAAQNSIMAMWIQDYPLYAVNPSFDASINVPGYESAPSG
jgi:hypothetical protein